jgi:AcrR family transcriptional regulator
MDEGTLDARQLRTRRALEEAILRLATDRPVSEVTMAALAREAGLHRTTLYQHLRSPAELLADVLQSELDAVREAHLSLPADGDVGAATRGGVLAVLDHLEAHAPIYRRELASGQSPLSAMLAAHFTASARALIEAHDLGPAGLEVSREIFIELAARWVGDAVVGAMTAWLMRAPPRDPEVYLRTHAALLPGWWPAP